MTTLAPSETAVRPGRVAAAHRRLHPLMASTAGRRWLTAGLAAVLIGAGYFYGLAAGAASGAWWADPRSLAMLAATAVTLPAIALRAARDIRIRHIGIELLVTIAVIGAVVIGEWWEAAAVTWLFTVGAALEATTLSRTRSALRELIDLAPASATVLRDGGQVEVDAFDVAVGELVLIKPGGRIPVDGTVTDGVAAVDEASITGESMPAEKTVGDRVFAGTIVAGGTLIVRTTGSGSDTTLAAIIHRVEEAQEDKAPAQRFIERFSKWYTPGVVLLAAGTYLVTRDLEMALTLLVIGCPGALVISIPVSIVVGIGRSARRGILIKGGEHLETTSRVTAIAFDKTGTLTRGEPHLTDVIALDPSTPHDDILALAAAAEASSEHPLASPVLAAAAQRGLTVPPQSDGFVQYPGGGVSAVVAGDRAVVGTARLMRELGIDLPAEAAPAANRITEAGRTVVFVAHAGRVRGAIGVADQVRGDAAETVARLRELGVGRILMLTGDHPRVAAAVAAEVGITEVHAGLLPEDKLTVIRQLQADGEVVAMVGDGVNDAPALAAADVGIAMGTTGTDVAMATAEVAILSERLGRVADAITTARRTVTNLRQNVTIALVTVAVLLAGVFASAVQMAGGMLVHEISVLVVILNATRLFRVGRPATRRRSAPSTQQEVAWQGDGASR